MRWYISLGSHAERASTVRPEGSTTVPVSSCRFSLDLAAAGVGYLQHHLDGHHRMLVLLEDVAALLGEFIGAAWGGQRRPAARARAKRR